MFLAHCKTQFITRDVIPACEKIDVLPIYIDFWSNKYSPQNAFIDAVTTTLESRRNIFSKLLTKLKFTPTLSSSGVNVKAEPDNLNAQRPTLHPVFVALNAHDTPVLLLLDEVQHLATSADYASFTAALRSFMTAPHDASNDDIHQVVTKRARWIWDNLQQFEEQQSMVLPRQYVSGETQFYLGRRYVLKVSLSETQRSDIKLYRGKLQVTVSAALYDAEMSRQAKVKSLLKRWYADISNYGDEKAVGQLLGKRQFVV